MSVRILSEEERAICFHKQIIKEFFEMTPMKTAEKIKYFSDLITKCKPMTKIREEKLSMSTFIPDENLKEKICGLVTNVSSKEDDKIGDLITTKRSVISCESLKDGKDTYLVGAYLFCGENSADDLVQEKRMLIFEEEKICLSTRIYFFNKQYTDITNSFVIHQHPSTILKTIKICEKILSSCVEIYKEKAQEENKEKLELYQKQLFVILQESKLWEEYNEKLIEYLELSFQNIEPV